MQEGAKILVVEDEAIVSMNLEVRLLQMGFNVVGVVSDREEALRVAGLEHPDLVLMDINLERSGYDGIDIAGELNGTIGPMPVVYLSAYADNETLERAKTTNPFGYVVKPFSLKDLHATIEMALHRFRVERKLQSHDDWLATTLQNIVEGVIVTDYAGRIQMINPAAAQLSGWNEHEALGRDIDEVLPIHDESGPVSYPTFAHNALAEQVPMTEEPRGCTLVRRDGRHFCIVQSAAPFSCFRSGKSGIVLTFRDISERKRLEESLLRSNEELQQFASAASHDLQEPLRTITSYSQLLQRTLQDRLIDDEQKLVELISEGARRMSTLVARLLEYGRLGREPEHRENFPASEALEEALRNLGAYIAETQAEITYDLTATVNTDRIQFTAVLQNLISNALRYRGSNRPKVHVSNQMLPSGPVFCVADNGIGIAPSHHGRIFGVFTRLQASDTSGSGLGLAICKRIVERHGGRIWLESAEGEGARFFFTLGGAPASEPQCE